MPMTDTDNLSTPADMVELLRRLTKIVRDVEALPDNAQQRFWDDTSRSLEMIPVEDLRLEGATSTRTVTVLYSLLVSMFGPRLTEMVNGAAKEYYESIISQMKDMTLCDWDTFLDQKFDETKGTDHEGSLFVSVVLSHNNSGYGTLKRVEGGSGLLKLNMVGSPKGERYFSSKTIISMELAPPKHDETSSTISSPTS